MKNKKQIPQPDKKEETVTDLKKEPQKDESIKKGYNEKNPTQPEGAFVPDSNKKS